MKIIHALQKIYDPKIDGKYRRAMQLKIASDIV